MHVFEDFHEHLDLKEKKCRVARRETTRQVGLELAEVVSLGH
jgi:hypothetical protein